MLKVLRGVRGHCQGQDELLLTPFGGPASGRTTIEWVRHLTAGIELSFPSPASGRQCDSLRAHTTATDFKCHPKCVLEHKWRFSLPIGFFFLLYTNYHRDLLLVVGSDSERA